MKTLKAILNQTVDLILGLIALGLVIWYMIEPSNNFSGALILYVGYVAFNIKEKVKMVLRQEQGIDSKDDEEFFHTVV